MFAFFGKVSSTMASCYLSGKNSREAFSEIRDVSSTRPDRSITDNYGPLGERSLPMPSLPIGRLGDPSLPINSGRFGETSLPNQT